MGCFIRKCLEIRNCIQIPAPQWHQNATKKYFHLPLLNLVTVGPNEVSFQIAGDLLSLVSVLLDQSCKNQSNWTLFSGYFYSANFIFHFSIVLWVISFYLF